jgi:integrase
MARTIREARLGSPTARARLKSGRMAHWNTVITGRAHLGWQRWPEDKTGRWLLRRRVNGCYSTEEIGRADDSLSADGVAVLTFEQARARALDLASTAEGKPAQRITVQRAVANYIDALAAQGKSTRDARSAAVVYILPKLGHVEVASLTSAQLRYWLAGVAGARARGKPAPADDEALRKRRATANKVFTILKAALNHAYDEKHVAARDAWGRRVKRFQGVDIPRARYLSTAEAVRFINACQGEFRLLVRAALETGCRYSELGRLVASDFNPDAGTVTVRKSKTNRERHVVLTGEGAEFFAKVCAGRPGSALMFARPDGKPWGASNQPRYMLAASLRARIEPPVTFHGLRHTWASLAVMNGMPLMVVARNLGHVDTKQVERSYGHLSQSYIFDAVRAAAPRFAVAEPSNVEPLRKR